MKRLALLLPIALLLQGCVFGSLARKHALAPSIDLQVVDVVAFAGPGEESDLFTAAVKRRDWPSALAVWPIVQVRAVNGINAGKESQGVKESFLEQVTRLDASLRKAVASGQ